jgi:hypothetical protein
MSARHVARSLPGWVATGVALIATTLLCFMGAASMFYEGWGQPFPLLLIYLIPGAACFTLCLVALRWPLAGAILLFAAGAIAGAWWLLEQLERDGLSVQVAISLAIIFGPVILAACLFLLEARHQRLLREEGVRPSPRWIARNVRYLLVAGIPLLTVAILSAMRLPEVLSRHDDGLRGARLIEGNGVTLVWAPQGPGWNRTERDGEYPSWNMIASYGVPPIGVKTTGGGVQLRSEPADMERTSICAYLTEDGTTLRAEPFYIWRMPTADEIVRSLTRDGVSAGCAWDGQATHASCRTPPDKETPLWAPDQPPIYYLAVDVPDEEHALGVNYTGGITHHRRSSRGQGFRCVKALP